jgi:hypothetical protein
VFFKARKIYGNPSRTPYRHVQKRTSPYHIIVKMTRLQKTTKKRISKDTKE